MGASRILLTPVLVPTLVLTLNLDFMQRMYS
jgi:hypothetical protein